MNISPMAYAESLRIGTVDFVSPSKLEVLLDIETPDGVALNTGVPRPFPRINGYVLISNEEGFLVAQVGWITVERSQYPERKGMQDFGLIDLPYPLRKMSLTPLGCLKCDGLDKDGNEIYKFKRGVETYPTVGDGVMLPTSSQLTAIIESGDHRRVMIGNSPLADNAEVAVDPDRLFGRHLAVLGNTGSGKSCSVAGLIRWSMEAARKARKEGKPNARFIVLDPNGEYADTFKGMSEVRRVAVEPDDTQNVGQLEVPLWFWNSAEWCAFTQASPKAQRPTLIQALRSVRDGALDTNTTSSHEMRRFLSTLITILRIDKNKGSPWARFPHPKNFLSRLKSWSKGLDADGTFSDDENDALDAIRSKIVQFDDARQGNHPDYEFTRDEVNELLELMTAAHSEFGGGDSDVLPIDADIPREFNGDELLRSIEANAELLGTSEHVETMLMRVRTLLSDTRMKVVSAESGNVTLEQWLIDYIGDNQASNGAVTVIDLSLVPSEVLHVVTAVMARMALESLQRYRKGNDGKTLPTVLVMEEAHTFIKKYKDDGENQNSAAICCQVFEKIAREGRKFGLGLVLSSQRPSELSPTVLSQCNSFLLHRISNDRDQDLVHKLVPDNLEGLLRDLPSLPSQHAILLGWASELPVLVRMRSLPQEHRPVSNDPDFWAVWSGKNDEGEDVQRNVNWKAIADEWQQRSNDVHVSDEPDDGQDLT